ncbi:MAG: T9SS type A sorting domain-containing protein [Cryomorphaceae bacterium]|nr:T9SS type A sorting domain-containing protein [Cryomorphaceae bacterium]
MRHYLFCLLYALGFSVVGQTSGDVDSSFVVGNAFNNSTEFIGQLQNGKILVTGNFTAFDGTPVNRLALFNQNGSLDTTFLQNSSLGANNAVRSTAIDTADYILIGGIFTQVNGVSKPRFAMLTPNGQLVNSFPSGTGPNNDVRHISTNWANGVHRILISGFFTTYNGVFRHGLALLHGDGALDTNFVVPPAMGGWVYSHHLYDDKRMLVGGGFMSSAGAPFNGIVRLNPDGSVDSTFNPGWGTSGPVFAVHVQSDGKIIIGGGFSFYNGVPVNRIVRLNDDGSIDTTFNSGSGFNSTVRHISTQSDGRVLVAGQFSNYQGNPASFFARLLPNGDFDPSMQIGSGFNGSTTCVNVQSDDKILISGAFSEYKSSSQERIVRLINNDSLVMPAPHSFHINFDFSVQNVPASAPDSIPVVVDTFPLNPTNPAYQFYMHKTGNQYNTSQQFNLGYQFYYGNREVVVTYPCLNSDTSRVLSLSSTVYVGNDSIFVYSDTLDFCTPPNYQLGIQVSGAINSVGQRAMVQDHSLLVLLQQDPTGQISIADTLMSGTVSPRYFNQLDSGQLYTVLAIPLSSHTFLYLNNLPTYLGNESSWIDAQWKTPSTIPSIDTILLITTRPTNGGNTASGNATSGNPRGTTNDPVVGLLMSIEDFQGNLINFQFTDRNGDFRFEFLIPGQYKVYGEALGKISDTAYFQISSQNGTFGGLNFEVTETQILYNGVLSVNANELTHVRVFPNPTQDVIQISFEEPFDGWVEIYSMHGRIIYQKKLNNTTQNQISLAEHSSGVYLMRLRGNDESEKIVRIVKL